MSTEWEDWLKEERAEGEAIGEAKGKEKGEARLASLIHELIVTGRSQDITSAVSDVAARQKLYQEFNIQ